MSHISYRKIEKFLSLPYSVKLRWFNAVIAKVKGRLFYRFLCRSFGKNSFIIKPLLLSFEEIYVGDNVMVYSHSRIESVKNKKGRYGSIYIGNGTSIEQRVHITACNRVFIGQDCLITFDVMITDIDHEYRDIKTRMAEQELLESETVIGNNCFIGSGAKIQAGTVLGQHCIVGANAVVRGVFPDYSVIVGIPARIVKRYNPYLERWESIDPSDCGYTES